MPVSTISMIQTEVQKNQPELYKGEENDSINTDFLDPVFDALPIGNRAEILEMLMIINNYSEERYGLNKKVIGPIKIRKNFTWGHNTRPKIMSYINSIRWGKTEGSFSRMFNYERHNNNGYLEKRYKNKVLELDGKLRSLRWAGTPWIEDDAEKDRIILESKDKFLKEIFETCENYDLNLIQHTFSVRYGVPDIEDITLIPDNLIPILENIANLPEQTNDLHYINFKEDKQICIAFDIKDDMEIFYTHDRTPLKSFPNGKIIVVLEYSYVALAKMLLNLNGSSNQNRPFVISVWHRMENNDQYLKHPFIAEANNIYHWRNGQMASPHLADQLPRWNHHQGSFSVCFGDFNIKSYLSKFQLTRLMHNILIWNKTFRIGLTNPINHVGYGWYGMIENPTPALIARNAAFYPDICKQIIQRRRDAIRQTAIENSLDNLSCHDICTTCEKRCLDAEKEYNMVFTCSNHPNYIQRKEERERREAEAAAIAEVSNTNEEESSEEIEESMRRWVVANR